MRNLIAVIVICTALFSGNKALAGLPEEQSYIVTVSGDTVLCRYLYDEQLSKITFQNMISADEHVMKKKDIQCYRRVYMTGDIINHSFLFRRMPVDPAKPDGKSALMHELIAHKGNSLWKYDLDQSLTYYYVYNKGLYKGEINQNDHVNELVKYFGDCSQDILESDEFNKYYSFSYVRFSEIFNKICVD